MYYYGARYYDSDTGRWFGVDPLVLQSSLLDSLSDPQRLNAYTYARNNPLRYLDPDGNDFTDFAKTLISTLPVPQAKVAAVVISLSIIAYQNRDNIKELVKSTVSAAKTLVDNATKSVKDEIKRAVAEKSGGDPSGNGKKPIGPEAAIPIATGAQQVGQKGWESFQKAKDWFQSIKFDNINNYGIENLLQAKEQFGKIVNGENVVKAFQEGQIFIDKLHPENINKIIKVGDQFLRVVIGKGNQIYSVFGHNSISPDRFTPLQ